MSNLGVFAFFFVDLKWVNSGEIFGFGCHFTFKEIFSYSTPQSSNVIKLHRFLCRHTTSKHRTAKLTCLFSVAGFVPASITPSVSDWRNPRTDLSAPPARDELRRELSQVSARVRPLLSVV